MINLRDYQCESIDALYAWFGQHEKGNPLLVLPTGAGKSVIAAALVQEIIEKWPSQRILIVTHVKELIEQNYLKLMELWPQAPAGVNSASLKRRDADSQIIFAGIQSIYNRPYELGWFDLILVDEAHLIPVKTMTGMYRTLLDQMENINPAIRIVGLTATPYRLDDGLLTEGKNKLFHDIAYEIPIKLLLDRGYLCSLTTQPTSTRATLAGVKKQGGDFVISQLAQAVDQEEITKAAIAEVVELASDRKSWLIFCVTVAHAENVRDEIRSYGIPCEMVTGDTPKAERHTILTQFKRGHIKALVNVSVLTTGFDAPCIDLMVYLRPTQSLSLYVQMAGRGMRLKEGKESCLVLDFAGNIARHGPIDAINPPKKMEAGESTAAPTKECPGCGSTMHAAAKECADCGYIFPSNPKHEDKASTLAILTAESPIELEQVSEVIYSRHQKEGKPDSLRVDYYAGFRRTHSEWVCIEHAGIAGSEARAWVHVRLSDEARRALSEYPIRKLDTLLTIAHELKKPSALKLKQSGKFKKVIEFIFQ